MDKFKILSPTAILGYGFPEASFEAGLAEQPNLIAVDAGSADPGPFYLGSGKSFTDRSAVRRDLSLLLVAAVSHDIPLVIGSAGGAGAAPHLQWTVDIIRELARELRLELRLGVIAADIDKEILNTAVEQQQLSPLPGAPELTTETIDETSAVVAQMGVEPIQKALNAGCQVIVAGRAYDPAVFAALPILEGYDTGLCLHLGKILECAAIAATPGSGADCALGILEKDRFVLQPLTAQRQFTTSSVAAHTLYEKSHPTQLPGPGGHLDLEDVCFEDIGHGAVAVSGSRFVPSQNYTLKLEGARRVGYRSIAIAGIRDPIMIASIDSILEQVRQRSSDILSGEPAPGSLHFHVYGKDAVMGGREPAKDRPLHELGIVIDAIGPDPESAATLCSVTRSTLLHFGYEGRLATAGNLAFPFSPSDLQAGEVYEFSIYHLLQADAESLFPITVEELTNGHS